MKQYKNVRSAVKPDLIRTDDFSVYVSTNIREVAIPYENGGSRTEYEYDQSVYTKDEYIQLELTKSAATTTSLSDTLDTLLIAMLEGDD